MTAEYAVRQHYLGNVVYPAISVALITSVIRMSAAFHEPIVALRPLSLPPDSGSACKTPRLFDKSGVA
jgi:hypothetical protein